MTDAHNALSDLGDALKHAYPSHESEIIDFMFQLECKLNAKERKWSKKP